MRIVLFGFSVVPFKGGPPNDSARRPARKARLPLNKRFPSRRTLHGDGYGAQKSVRQGTQEKVMGGFQRGNKVLQ
jgi:hypothetical protein